jgi:hypothetical protein
LWLLAAILSLAGTVDEPLAPEEPYAATDLAPNSPPGGAGLILLEDLAADENGADLAVAKVSAPVIPRLTWQNNLALSAKKFIHRGFHCCLRQSDRYTEVDL